MGEHEHETPESAPDEQTPDTATLTSRSRWRISPVWLIPLVVLAIGGWLFYQNIISHGPVITLTLDTADGIKAGGTDLKVRSVTVGHVTDVALSHDHRHALLTVQMNAGTANLLGDDSQFWVVRPRVGPRGITGLNTIISGAYLQMHPGGSASGKRRFKVRDTPPVTPSDKPGVHIKLVSVGDNSLSVGDPIVYQGENVGDIESTHFSLDKKQMVYGAFVKKPYANLVTEATQFWLRSGVDFHVGSGGVDVKLGSLRSVLAGGVTFAEPRGVEAGGKAGNGDKYKLYETQNAATQDRFDRKIEYVVLLNDSVRGLTSGAPVEYRGLRMGTVEKVPFYPPHFSLDGLSGFRIPVLIAIEPQRSSLRWAHWNDKQFRKHNRRFFTHGLRATIKSSNLLTGSMFIDLTFDKHADAYKPRKVGGYPVFPSEPSRITSLQQQLSNIMNKIDNIDFQSLSGHLKHTLATTEKTVERLNRITRHIDTLLQKPSTRNLPSDLDKTLSQLRQTLAGFQKGAPAYERLNQSLEKLNRVLDNVAPLSRTLRDHPSSLIFGKPGDQDPIPQAGSK